MNGLHRTLIAVLVLALNATAFVPERAEAGVTVEDLELVSKTRVGRAIELSYRLTVDNVGTTLNGVKVYVSCDAAGTTMLDDVVEFGDIAENAATTSVDTFTIRLDRRVANVPSCLSYVIGFDTIVRLSGTATDMPLANATIIGTIVTPESGRPIIDSGRPIIDTVIVTADADGNYEMELQAVTEDDFITLEAQGTGDQEGAVLTSSVGSVGSLQEAGESGSIIIGSGDFGALNITHITTAQDELVRRLNGGVPPTSDAELAALQAQVDGAELLLLATTIKTIIDNAIVVLPPGIDSTLELIQQDPAVVEAFTEALQNTFPQEFETALVETADALQLGYTVDEIPGKLYAATRDELPLTGGAYVFDFGVNGDGTVTFAEGQVAITWALNVDGEIEVTPTDPFLLFESFPFLPQCSINPSGQCRTLTFLEAIRIVRLSNGLVYDQVFVLSTTRVTYPDDPLPDEIIEGIPGPDSVLLAFGDDGILPITPADVAGDQVATYYFHQDNNSIGLNAPTLGVDFLTFNPNGTGSTARRGFGFTWAAATNGALNVAFDNGDSNEFILFSEDGDVAQVIVIGTFAATGDSFTFGGEAISYDGVSDFSQQNLANLRYRNIAAVLTPEEFFPIFDYLFLADGTGCRIIGDENNTSSQRLVWESTALNRMDSTRLFDLPPLTPLDRRGWQAIDEEPGEQGPRFWVIENADFSSLEPNYVFTDPEVTPGRMNAYELVDNVAGQFDPCGLGASTSLTTLFASDNGGVGNMFDVTTLGNAIEVNAFDVNVELAAGTDFDITVYTTPDTFLDGVTSGIPGCLVNCVDVGAWTQVATGTGTAAGIDAPTRVDVPPFVLDGGTTTGIWITLSRDGSIVDEFRYTNGGGFVDNADIVITFGTGVSAPDVTTGLESVFLDRVWNGTIYYNTR